MYYYGKGEQQSSGWSYQKYSISNDDDSFSVQEDEDNSTIFNDERTSLFAHSQSNSFLSNTGEDGGIPILNKNVDDDTAKSATSNWGHQRKYLTIGIIVGLSLGCCLFIVFSYIQETKIWNDQVVDGGVRIPILGKSKRTKKKKFDTGSRTIHNIPPRVSLGPRPFFLVSQLQEDNNYTATSTGRHHDDNDSSSSSLKQTLQSCATNIKTYKKSNFVFGHRGASLQFPEHTYRSYNAAAVMGAGVIECDVTFTKDLQLICRHSQCDLHQTTNILMHPELASKCTIPFIPSKDGETEEAQVQCCTSDFTLKEIQSLCGKMDSHNKYARTPLEYMGNIPTYRTGLYSHDCPYIPSHNEYIQYVKELDRKFTPELKIPMVKMPFIVNTTIDNNITTTYYTQEMYASQMIQAYIDANIPPKDVYPQAKEWTNIYYWKNSFPEYMENVIALDDIYNIDYEAVQKLYMNKEWLRGHFQPLMDNNVKIIAPPVFMLLTTNTTTSIDDKGKETESITLEPSLYSKIAKNEFNLDIITWTLERSDSLAENPGTYYKGLEKILKSDGDIFTILHALAQKVIIRGVFTDWASTVTFYSNCFHSL